MDTSLIPSFIPEVAQKELLRIFYFLRMKTGVDALNLLFLRYYGNLDLARDLLGWEQKRHWVLHCQDGTLPDILWQDIC
jgi:hypothetical protein